MSRSKTGKKIRVKCEDCGGLVHTNNTIRVPKRGGGTLRICGYCHNQAGTVAGDAQVQPGWEITYPKYDAAIRLLAAVIFDSASAGVRVEAVADWLDDIKEDLERKIASMQGPYNDPHFIQGIVGQSH